MIHKAHKVWSELPESTQNEILDKLKSGTSAYSIASFYDLNPSSLERKWRKIRSRLEKRQVMSAKPVSYSEKPKDVLSSYKYDKEQEDRPPAFDSIYAESYSKKYDAILYGQKDSIPSERILNIKTKEHVKILFFTDTHFGEHDQEACDAFIKVASVLDYDIMIHGGDCLECYGLSQYGKDPRKMFTQSLRSEVEEWKKFSGILHGINDCDKFMIFGNHMDRYYRWLSENPAVYDINDMQLDRIMRLSDYNYMPMVNSIYFDATNVKDFPNPKMVIHHGSVSRKSAGNSSRAESENLGLTSSISGHVHRLSVSYRRTLRSQIVYAEGGTLRTLSPSWMNNPDWQHGCLYIDYDVNNNYISVSPILIQSGKAYVGGDRIV